MSDELKKIADLVEAQGKALDAFKAENDNRLKEIEAKGHADPLLADKVKTIAEDVAKIYAMKTQLDSIETAVAKMQAEGLNVSDKKDKPIYASIGDQLVDVITADWPDASASKKMVAVERLSKVKAAASGANETVPSEAGFLVEKDSGTMLDRGVIATGLLSSKCFNVPCSANSNRLELNLLDETSRATGSRFGGIRVYPRAEADTVTASKPKFRLAEWKLKDFMGLMYATGEVLTDAPQLSAVVNKWFPMEFGFMMDDQIVNGTGGGNFTGIINADCTISQAVATGQGTRASNPNKVIYRNVVDIYSRLLSSSDPNSVWYINRALLPDIMMMTIPVGTGGAPVFLPPNGAAGQPYMTLLNKPIIPIEQCAAPGSVGDIMLVDLNEYLLLTKGGIEAAASIHVRFIYNEMTLRWTYRADGGPIRNKALTPYKGSNTLGPFITLAAS